MFSQSPVVCERLYRGSEFIEGQCNVLGLEPTHT
jgi:hypothetical protein